MKSNAQQRFEQQRENLTDREIMLEILYANYLTYKASEKTRANTSTLVWFVIIGIVLSVGLGILSALAIA